jgi:hypothetical protein
MRPRDSLFDFQVFVRVSKPDFPRIFCSSFKLFENQTVRSSRVHCIYNVAYINKYMFSLKHEADFLDK